MIFITLIYCFVLILFCIFSSISVKNCTNSINLPLNSSFTSQKSKAFPLGVQNTPSTCKYDQIGPFCDECGLQFAKPNTRIFGGNEAVPQSWPSVVYIVFSYKLILNTSSNDSNETLITTICGGSLINRNTVLTAAHCIIDYLYEHDIAVEPNSLNPTIESMYTVYLGVNNISELNASYVRKMSVKNIIKHPNYDLENLLNDLAILKLDGQVDYNEYIQPACLPTKSFIKSQSNNAWIVGWGLIKQNQRPNILHNAKIKLLDSNFCKYVAKILDKDWDLQICAGDPWLKKDVCKGDSGGPLYVMDKREKYVLYGIISYGDRSCGTYPGIFTRIDAYIEWIKQNA